MVLVTGSSGYVAGKLVKLLSNLPLSTVDKLPGPGTMHVLDLNNAGSLAPVVESMPDDYKMIHLAAARTDFKCDPNEYYRDNVAATEVLLRVMEKKLPTAFVHLSSVAAIDGARLNFGSQLGEDDAYRSTKYIQENAIVRWADSMRVPLWCLAPSAIFDESRRGDTNIGKLQKIASVLKFIPDISSKKSLTYLDNLCAFIEACLTEQVEPGKYLTLEQPILSVSEILLALMGGSGSIRKVPLLKETLYSASLLLYPLKWIAGFDPVLTPNRVVKLFRDTDYPDASGYDAQRYPDYCKTDLRLLLKNCAEMRR